MHLSLKGLIIKEGKKDRPVFDSSFLAEPYSKCINSFATREDEVLQKFEYTFYKHLKRKYNQRITYPVTELATMEDNVLGTYRHCKLHSDISAVHVFMIDLILFLPLEYIFGSNIVNFRWEIIAQARSYLSEYYQSRSNVQSLVKNIVIY